MTPGVPVVTLADDSILEVSIPIDSVQARQWLRFNGHPGSEGKGWFADLEPVECKIRWTQASDHQYWLGRLHRVESFEEEMRQLAVLVRVTTREALSGGQDGLPLVDGMFCEVQVPGKVLEGVYRVPRSAVSFEGTVYVARDGRLQTQRVELAYEQGQDAFLAGGLKPGDLVIVTRLVNPLENALLDIRMLNAQEGVS